MFQGSCCRHIRKTDLGYSGQNFLFLVPVIVYSLISNLRRSDNILAIL